MAMIGPQEIRTDGLQQGGLSGFLQGVPCLVGRFLFLFSQSYHPLEGRFRTLAPLGAYMIMRRLLLDARRPARLA
jgi:hypothetical protein